MTSPAVGACGGVPADADVTGSRDGAAAVVAADPAAGDVGMFATGADHTPAGAAIFDPSAVRESDVAAARVSPAATAAAGSEPVVRPTVVALAAGVDAATGEVAPAAGPVVGWVGVVAEPLGADVSSAPAGASLAAATTAAPAVEATVGPAGPASAGEAGVAAEVASVEAWGVAATPSSEEAGWAAPAGPEAAVESGAAVAVAAPGAPAGVVRVAVAPAVAAADTFSTDPTEPAELASLVVEPAEVLREPASWAGWVWAAGVADPAETG